MRRLQLTAQRNYFEHLVAGFSCTGCIKGVIGDRRGRGHRRKSTPTFLGRERMEERRRKSRENNNKRRRRRRSKEEREV